MEPVKGDFRVLFPNQVRYNEVDMQNVVFNANYLVYADLGCGEYFRTLAKFMADGRHGHSFFGPKGDMMVRHCEIDFRASAKADDLLHIGARVKALGRTSFTMEMAMFRDDALLANVHLRYVHVDNAHWRPMPVPPFFRDAVTRFEVRTPD